MNNATVSIGIETPSSDWSAAESLAELGELATTAGLSIHHTFYQKLNKPNQLSYVGRGKLIEIKTHIIENSIQIALFDDELSPMQQRHIENSLEIKVLDRTSLILDIFSQRAQTKEAQIQIELAQLDYIQPRLRRMWTHLSRLGGGIGTRGPGETQLEVDRRQIGRRILKLKQDLKKVASSRHSQRKKRIHQSTPTIAIMGYTNAGKSTIHNLLTESQVLQENKLFATLDPTTRQFTLTNNATVLLTDTVGFIRKLPRQLVTAFKATLEEVIYADLVLHIIDCSNPRWRDLMNTSLLVLKQLNIEVTNEIIIFNKIDLAHDPVLTKHECSSVSSTFVSAKQPATKEKLMALIETHLKKLTTTMTFDVPHDKMEIYSKLYQKSRVIRITHLDNKIQMVCEINKILGTKLMNELHRL
jgi:GTP-binding protein HflX